MKAKLVEEKHMVFMSGWFRDIDGKHQFVEITQPSPGNNPEPFDVKVATQVYPRQPVVRWGGVEFQVGEVVELDLGSVPKELMFWVGPGDGKLKVRRNQKAVPVTEYKIPVWLTHEQAQALLVLLDSGAPSTFIMQDIEEAVTKAITPAKIGEVLK